MGGTISYVSFIRALGFVRAPDNAVQLTDAQLIRNCRTPTSSSGETDYILSSLVDSQQEGIFNGLFFFSWLFCVAKWKT